MCGIAGIVARERQPGSRAMAERMSAAMRHRGPDAHGVEDLGACTLANTRLAIVDLSERGHMPMTNEDASVWITYNGECYNAPQLRQTLVQKGHQFRSATDTEVVLHLYEEHGDDCVEKLRGMFAFAIWDSRQERLLLARDRLGIKPLYYYDRAARFLFASEIKGLLASDWVPRKLDPSGVRVFLQLGHVPPPWTAIDGVRPLEPGHIGVWERGEFRTSPYWALPASTSSLAHAPEVEIASTLGEILIECGRKQLMSDVPIALFLSGGIDSAVLGTLMRQAGAEQLTALTIGFEDKSFDESELSNRTAELLGIPRHVIQLPASQMSQSLDHAFWAMDQPTVDGLNAYWISRAAAEAGFKVALSGQGGDELFGGYESIAWFNRFSHVASWLKPFPRDMGEFLFDRESLPFRWRKLSYLFGADDPFVAAQMSVRFQLLEKNVHELLSPDLQPANGGSEAAAYILKWAEQTTGQDLRERIAFLDFPIHLEARLLRDGDAMSMAHSLEIRPILLDHTAVEYVLSLPPAVRLQNKKLLLDATRRFMPDGLYADLLSRPKRTFSFPFAQWLGGDLRDAIEQTFSEERLSTGGLFNRDAVEHLWDSFVAKPESVGWPRPWSVFVLARWCEIMRVGP